MTVKINFDDQYKEKIIQLLDWLKDLSLINSYEIESPDSDNINF